ncbi:MAG: hypothetical protein M1826_001531 [Phylliscum demangeonii]|nr:MAG: hypothetical protein M1826_001531 [Phylliscum demangeonii]
MEAGVESAPGEVPSSASSASKPDGTPEKASSADSRPALSRMHEAVFVAVMCSAQLLTQAAFAQGLAPLHIIGDHFHDTNAGQLSWYAAAYSLTVGTFILIAGRLGDMYGHKRMFLFGYAWLALWSLLAGVSYYSTEVFFISCRALQGVGPAFLLPNALALLGRIYPSGSRKNFAFSLFGATAPVGFMVGAVFSVLCGERTTWAWAYWLMAITGVVMVFVGAWVIPRPSGDRDRDGDAHVHGFDFAGSASGVSGLVLINVAWNQGPIVGWGTPYTYILLLLGLGCMAVFAFVEMRVAAAPLIPLKAFTGETGFVLACLAAGWAAFGIWIFYGWQFLYELRHASAMSSVAQFSPVAITGLVAAIVTGRLLSLPRFPKPAVMTMALVAFTTGIVLFVTMPVRQSYWPQFFVSVCVMPWGMDMSFPAATLILSEAVSAADQGIAASLVSTIVNYSISIGLGIAGTVATRVRASHPDPAGPAAALASFRSAWYVGIGLSGLGLLVSLLAAYMDRRRKSRLPPARAAEVVKV